jgi:hypothetical protein
MRIWTNSAQSPRNSQHRAKTDENDIHMYSKDLHSIFMAYPLAQRSDTWDAKRGGQLLRGYKRILKLETRCAREHSQGSNLGLHLLGFKNRCRQRWVRCWQVLQLWKDCVKTAFSVRTTVYNGLLLATEDYTPLPWAL